MCPDAMIAQAQWHVFLDQVYENVLKVDSLQIAPALLHFFLDQVDEFVLMVDSTMPCFHRLTFVSNFGQRVGLPMILC
jgi:hypothetical protein